MRYVTVLNSIATIALLSFLSIASATAATAGYCSDRCYDVYDTAGDCSVAGCEVEYPSGHVLKCFYDCPEAGQCWSTPNGEGGCAY
jgi:hypothetical protein